MIAFFLCILCTSIDEPNDTQKQDDALKQKEQHITHFECFNTVRMIERQLLSGQNSEEIATKLKMKCDKLHATRKTVCDTIIGSKLKQIIDLINDKKLPQFVCDAIGFRHTVEQERQIKAADCEEIVNKLKAQYQNFKPIRRPMFNKTGLRIPENFLKKDKPQENEANNGAKFLEDPPSPDSNNKDNSASTDKQHDRPFGLRPENGIKDRRYRSMGRIPFGIGPVCKELPPENRMACHIISRFVFKGLRQGAEESAQQICQNLNNSLYIKLV